MNEPLLVLHLSKRVDRYDALQLQLAEQGITHVIYFEGLVEKHNRKKGVTLGFQKIIQYAKDNKIERCHIAEDDLFFLHPKGYQYYLSQIPADFDCFWSMFFVGGNDENFNINQTCSGMTLVTVHSRFYDFILNMDSNCHIDRYITSLHKQFVLKVCPLIPCTQSGSKSDNTFHTTDYSPLLEGRSIYKGEDVAI